jgi:para-nitrobenzyl esterase
VFGTYEERFFGSGPKADALSEAMQDAWLAFAKTGDPSCESLGKVPEYDKNRATIIFGEECTVQEAPYEIERKAWDKVGGLTAGRL